MRYFFSAAGSTFHVGSSKLTLKLLRLSELSCFVALGAVGVSGGGGMFRDLSAEIDGSVEGPAFWFWEMLGVLCSSRRGEGCGDSISVFVGDFCGLTNCAHLNEGCLRIPPAGESS